MGFQQGATGRRALVSYIGRKMSKLVDHTPNQGRRRIHSRQISVTGYLRADRLLDLEARLTDTKGIDYPISTGTRRAGMPIHDMVITLTVDEQMNVCAVSACSNTVPYPGACETIASAYDSLVGLNLLDGFRQAVRERVGGVAGCTHLTELLSSVPTVALQTLASFKADNAATEGKPFQLDKCHALDTRGEVVRVHYPRWHTAR